MRTNRKFRSKYSAFTLAESMIAIVIVSLFVLMATMNITVVLGKNSFKTQAQELVSTMQMAASAAAESDRRYEVVIDLVEQNYMLRQITSHDLSEVLEEEVIVENDFNEKCQAVYVLFDDLVETSQDYQIATFRVGRAGWQNGGKIVLLDEDQQPHSVLVNRLNRIVRLQKGDVELLMPKTKNEVPF